ncbi:MAG: response regulator [Promethearchaeota archaeon]
MKKILIIEDNEKNLKLMKLILKKTQYEIFDAVNGQNGIALALQIIPDLIIMDIQMPILDGVDAMKIIKSDASTKNIPIIATTAYAMKGDRERFLNQGFDDYISKPIRIDDFLEKIKNKLKESASDS